MWCPVCVRQDRRLVVLAPLRGLGLVPGHIAPLREVDDAKRSGGPPLGRGVLGADLADFALARVGAPEFRGELARACRRCEHCVGFPRAHHFQSFENATPFRLSRLKCVKFPSLPLLRSCGPNRGRYRRCPAEPACSGAHCTRTDIAFSKVARSTGRPSPGKFDIGPIPCRERN